MVERHSRFEIEYGSRTLTPTEQPYFQIEKEGLAVVRTCEKSSHFLLGLRFHILTDHKPLLEENQFQRDYSVYDCAYSDLVLQLNICTGNAFIFLTLIHSF